MKTNMKKLAAWMLALLLVLQMIPAMGDGTQYTSEVLTSNSVYRDKLEIQGPKTIRVGESATITVVTEGYNELTWSSGNEEVATVENGEVFGISAGTAKITAKEGTESDSIIIKIIEVPANENENEDETENDENTEAEPKTAEAMVIIISGNKDKLTYDGQEHEYSGYTVDCSDSRFDESKLHLVNAEKAISAKNCGTYTIKYEATDFTYDDADVTVIYDLNDGWMQIKPAELTVTADDKTKLGNREPAYTATITGLVEGDDPSLINITYTIDGAHIIPSGEQIQGNYRIKYLAGNLNTGTSYTLYNIAEVGKDNWYRLRRTTITTGKKLEEYVKGKSKGTNVDVPASEYYTEPYDFTDEILTIPNTNKKYAHISRAGDGLDVQGYYTATIKESQPMVAVKGKVGGSKGCLTSDNYKEEGIDSFHCNYTVTLIDNPASFEEQDVYNMVSVNGSQNYHRLKRTTILAKPAEEQKKEATLNASDYVLDRYDFTNVTITIDGETYKYSPTKPTGLYDSCYTVQFENVKYQDRINADDSWYNNDDGWLDGSRYQYGDYGENLPRTTVGFHANYKATLYKGTKPPKSVKITSTWPSDKIAYPGTEITLKGEISGFSENVKLQWQHSTDKEKWINEKGANELTFTYTLNDETAKYYWRLVADDLE